jgi:hypothetical protein
MRTARVIAVLAPLVLLGLAPAARAAGSASQDSTTIRYEAQPGDADRFIMSGSGSGVAFYPDLPTVLEPDGVAINAGAGCGTVAATVLCPFRSTAVLDLGDGDDLAGIVGLPVETPATTVHAGPGNDIIGAPGASAPRLELFGDGDDDTLVDGGSDDTLDGGAGDDMLRYLAGGADDLHGGSGTDTVVFGATQPVVVSLDDVANDGPAAAPVANVHSDVEVVEGTPLADRLTGSGHADTLHGNAGDDTIAARDGVSDVIDCGAGNDTAVVDAVDVVSNCETVELLATGGGGDGGGIGGPAPIVTPPARIAALVQASWKPAPNYTTVAKLTVSKVPAGGRVEVRCTGRGCGFQRKAVTPKLGVAALAKAFKGHKLKPGAVIEVRITAPGMTGEVVRFAIRRGKKAPARSTLCLAAGATKPAACA